MKNKVGRPTEYNKDILTKAKKYILESEDEEVQQLVGLSAKGTELFKNKLNVKIPTIEGLALYLKINRDTIYDWEEKYKPFSDIIGELRAKQANALVSKGLSGDYNPTIAKVLLAKHGYRDGIEHMGKDGEKLELSVVRYETDNTTPI
jgi:ABC-type transport system substrate-binding protein